MKKYAPGVFTAKAGVIFRINLDIEDTAYFLATASIESAAIINGATLSLAYGPDSADNKMNFLEDQARAKNFGAITAKCKIEF